MKESDPFCFPNLLRMAFILFIEGNALVKEFIPCISQTYELTGENRNDNAKRDKVLYFSRLLKNEGIGVCVIK